tara:strand:+ start:295 stop:828 length:534 start_codon:yes stop_codon:yes gene_type:complete
MKKLIIFLLLPISIKVSAIDGLLLECKKGNTATHYFEFSIPMKEKIAKFLDSDQYQTAVKATITTKNYLNYSSESDYYYFNKNKIWRYENIFPPKTGEWMIDRKTGEMKRNIRECENLSDSERFIGSGRDDHPCHPNMRRQNLRDENLGYCEKVNKDIFELGKKKLYKPSIKEKNKF